LARQSDARLGQAPSAAETARYMIVNLVYTSSKRQWRLVEIQ